MDIFFSELTPRYESYTFPYAVYAKIYPSEDATCAYQNGFLPYSSNTALKDIVFYLARSLRVDLSLFSDTSENRRVSKKIDNPPIPKLMPIEDFDAHNQDFQKMCRSYIDRRFPAGAMSEERLRYILQHPLTTHVVDYVDDVQNRWGTVICSVHSGAFHYWFAFFDIQLMNEFPLGKWLMWRTIHLAKTMDIPHIYLGTCYGTKSLYKARDFRGVEWFDGRGWSTDLTRLKKYCHSDHETLLKDRLKDEGLI